MNKMEKIISYSLINALEALKMTMTMKNPLHFNIFITYYKALLNWNQQGVNFETDIQPQQ